MVSLHRALCTSVSHTDNLNLYHSPSCKVSSHTHTSHQSVSHVHPTHPSHALTPPTHHTHTVTHPSLLICHFSHPLTCTPPQATSCPGQQGPLPLPVPITREGLLLQENHCFCSTEHSQHANIGCLLPQAPSSPTHA